MATPHQDAQNGVTGAYLGGDQNILRAMTAFAAISWYNAVELIILCLVVFKKYKGLYFWSLFITSAAIIPYTVGAWGRLVGIIHSNLGGMILSNLGWVFMVNGESVVLYSRLHLVTQDTRILRGILAMIIINLVVLYPPTSVLAFGSQTGQREAFVAGYAVMEKLQMSIWSVQEIVVSGIYLWEVNRLLKSMYEAGTRKLMYELIAINVVIILLDIVLLTVEFLNYYQIEVTLKGMIYSIKLKMEFAVLNKLVKVVTEDDHGGDRSGSGGSGLQRIMTADTAALEKAIMPRIATPSHRNASKTDRDWFDCRSADHSPSSDWRDESIVFEPTEKKSVERKSSIEGLYPGRLD